MPFYQDNTEIASNINQPPSNNQCYWYAVRCANQISQIVLPKLDAPAPYQMGGNGVSIWQSMKGKGLNYDINYGTNAILNGLTAAINNDLPVVLLVHWTQGNKEGNHCVYLCGVEDGIITGRDQQNNHRKIEINTTGSNWGSDPGTTPMFYSMTSFSVGGESLDKLKPVDQAVKG